ncbi:hypothetical protein [uncultured Erythrobacter sp.]|uniref:hypothetical protein n=1 Tax=uncultured Erythrobacter sp. TaxID=263913 RepID=UPI00260963BE|nr:hypothetical protein [uncultured Erythrobacter sp.]
MEAERIKAARTRLWRAWVFGGMLWSVVFLMLAATIVMLFGVEKSSSGFAIAWGAAILAGGTYGIIMVGALLMHTIKRLVRGRPIVEEE